MKLKKILLIIILSIFIFPLAGCTLTHKSISAEEFMSIA